MSYEKDLYDSLAVIGALPEHITLKSLKTGLPADWEEQKKFLRIE